MEGQHAPAVAQ